MTQLINTLVGIFQSSGFARFGEPGGWLYAVMICVGCFLLYLAIMSVWALMGFFFPAIRNRLLQRILRSFFSLTVLASALLAAGLLGVKLPRSGRGLLALAAGCVVFFALSMSSYPPLRVGMLVAGMCLCLYYLMAAVNADYEGAALMLLPGAVTTGFRVWALMRCRAGVTRCRNNFTAR